MSKPTFVLPLVCLASHFVCHAWIPTLSQRTPRQLGYDRYLKATSSSDAAAKTVSALFPHVPILLETDRFLVINKPAGIPHHDDIALDKSDDEDVEIDRFSAEDTPSHQLGIVNLVRRQLARERGDSTIDHETSAKPSCIPRLYGVHRLDRVTSGILILAKDASTAGLLARAFQTGLVTKYYVGLSAQKATKKQGLVQGHMVRGRRKSWYLTRPTHGSDHGTRSDALLPFAKTRFFTSGVGHLQASSINATLLQSWPKTLLLFRPYTGKTHQLRVAAKSVGLPLWGDDIYSSDSAPRTYLHATAIFIPAHALHDHNDLTVWCVPPFESAWPDAKQHELYKAALDALVQKHCDCVELLSTYPSNSTHE